MGIKVVKFGGSSVADAIQLQKVKNIIEDTIRGIIMFVVLYLLSYMNVRL